MYLHRHKDIKAFSITIDYYRKTVEIIRNGQQQPKKETITALNSKLQIRCQLIQHRPILPTVNFGRKKNVSTPHLLICSLSIFFTQLRK